MKFLVLRETNISISKRDTDLFFQITLEHLENEVTLTRKESIKMNEEKVRKQVNSRTHMLKQIPSEG